mgnify:CR=1 FL=1
MAALAVPANPLAHFHPDTEKDLVVKSNSFLPSPWYPVVDIGEMQLGGSVHAVSSFSLLDVD